MNDFILLGLQPYATNQPPITAVSRTPTTHPNAAAVSPPTPEPSPVREMQDDLAPSTTTTTTLAVQRPTILSSHAMRRLSFSEEDSGSNNEYSWGVETGNMEDI